MASASRQSGRCRAGRTLGTIHCSMTSQLPAPPIEGTVLNVVRIVQAHERGNWHEDGSDADVSLP